MSQHSRIVGLSLLCLLLSSSLGFSEDDQQQVAMLPAPAAALQTPAASPVNPAWTTASIPQLQNHEFALGPGDGIKVTVWGYPELSEQVVILPDGQVSYPLIGILEAQGLSAQGLAHSIGQALEAHIQSPQVSVVVTDMRSRHFSVLGDVKTSGVYPLWNGGVTLLEAIAQAGGLGEGAASTDVQVFRDGSSIPEVFNLSALLAGALTDPMPLIHAGDVINIPSLSRRKICVLGDVNVPGLYSLTPDMTVIEALSSAGWVKPSGVITSVMLARRNTGGQPEFFRINAKRAVEKQDWTQHLVLQPGDIIFVPKQFIAKVGDFTSFFTSKVEPAAHTYLRIYDAANPANIVVDR